MENNTYKNNGINTTGTGTSGNHSSESDNAESSMVNSTSTADTAADNSTQTAEGAQESSSTYGYSYINQEQKNPYTVWRADENTADTYTGNSSGNAYGSTQTGSSSYDSNTYTGSQSSGYHTQYDNNTGNAYGSSAQSNYNNAYGSNNQPDYSSAYGSSQSGTNPSYGSTQSGTDSGNAQTGSYSDIYGNGTSQGGWQNYQDAKQQKKEERARKRAQKAANASPNFGVKLAKCASIALIFGLVAGTTFEGASYVTGNLLGTNTEQAVTPVEQEKEQDIVKSTEDTPKTTIQASSVSNVDVSEIVEACMPSIVAITNLSQVQVQNFFGQVQNYEIPSAGSGVIIGEDDEYLYIVTNNHVVESASTNTGVESAVTLTIQFDDKTTASAEIKGTDRSSDLAVVKVNKSDIEKDTLANIKVATLGDSDSVKVGSQAIAIGNALGYGQSVTGGWVSALNREVTIQDDKTGESFTNELIQTDAAINPGNSGGALLNNKGEVIGINSSKYSDTDVEGMGFAIPSNTAKPIIEDLIKREVVSDDKAAYLGLVGVDVPSTISSTYNIPEGVCIVEVTRGTAAEQYGLKKGDIIVKFDGKAVKTSKSLEKMLTYYEAGSEVDIVIQRQAEGGYQEQTVKVVLGKKNS